MFKSLKRRVALGAVAAVGAAGLVTIAAPAANAAVSALTVTVNPFRGVTGNGPSSISAIVTTTGTDTGTLVGTITSAPTPAVADSVTNVAVGDTITSSEAVVDWATAGAAGVTLGTRRAGAASTAKFSTPGTYGITWWLDNGTRNNLIDAGEPYSVSTITVGGTPTSLSLASAALTVAGTGPKTFSVILKDSSGTVTALNGSERVTMLVTSAIETMTVTGGTASSNRVITALGAPNTTNTAVGYIAAGDTATATSGAYTVSAALSGAASGTIAFNLGGSLIPATAVTGTLTASAAAYATSIAIANTVGVTASNGATKPGATAVSTSGKYVAPYVMDTGTSAAFAVQANATTASTLSFKIVGTAGSIVNVKASGTNVTSATTPVTLDASGNGTFTVTPTTAAGTVTVTTAIKDAAGTPQDTGYTATYTSAVVSAGAMAATGITSTPDLSTVTSQIVKTGATSTIKINVKDQYGVAKQFYAVTGTLSAASRNYGVTITQQFTDANGDATLTLTDASTSTTNLSDVITVQVTAPGSASPLLSSLNTLTISYSTSGTYAALTLTGGTTTTTTVSKAVLQLDNATNYAVTLTPSLKDAAGSAISGVALTYTGSDGVKFRSAVATPTAGGDKSTLTAASQTAIYAYGTKPGVATVTVTGGGLSATATFTVSAISAVTTARKIELAAAANKFTATVTDGWGNPVAGVLVNFATTSQGIFGGGVTSTSAVTDAAGTATAVVNSADGKAGSVTVSATVASSNNAQANDLTTNVADVPVTGFAAAVATATATGTVSAVTTTATTDAATTSKINDIATAVANLSTTVAGLVASLVAQIKDTKAAIADTKAALDALAAVVAKIQKKVKA